MRRRGEGRWVAARRERCAHRGGCWAVRRRAAFPWERTHEPHRPGGSGAVDGPAPGLLAVLRHPCAQPAAEDPGGQRGAAPLRVVRRVHVRPVLGPGGFPVVSRRACPSVWDWLRARRALRPTAPTALVLSCPWARTACETEARPLRRAGGLRLRRFSEPLLPGAPRRVTPRCQAALQSERPSPVSGRRPQRPAAEPPPSCGTPRRGTVPPYRPRVRAARQTIGGRRVSREDLSPVR